MKRITLILCTACVILLSGCSSNKTSDPIRVEINNNSSTKSVTATTTSAVSSAPENREDASSTQTSTTTTVQTTQPQHREETREAEPTEETEYQLCDCVIPYGDHYLSDEEKSFIGQSIFVGDSICLGFGSYGRVPKERVIARGSLGAWSFFDYDFSYKDKDCSYDYVLKKIKPKYVFLSMGMNDVNITNADMYCVNYSKIIDITLKETDARIFVCAINPVDSDFTSNERIEEFNSAMRDYVKEHYTGRVECIDYGRLFRCADGKKLCSQLSGGDGIHLAPYAYDMALWEIHNVLSENAAQSTEEQSAEAATSEQQ